VSLRLATSAFPMSADIGSNLRSITRQIRKASAGGAHLVHFPECALSGYAGVDFPDHRGFDWDRLAASVAQVQAAAAAAGVWVVLGSAHRLSAGHKPHNSVYVIDDEGAIRDRYDKLFCAGSASADDGDLAHYTPGTHFCVFEVRGVRCGVLICHDYRYPELYRQYKVAGVALMLHSFHAGNVSPERWSAMHAATGAENLSRNGGMGTLPGITMPATLVSMAANNYVWISASNTSARQSCWPSLAVRPDGVVVGKLRRNTAGLLMTTIDPAAEYYDSTVAWRDRAIDGVFHSGETVQDPRSDDRTSA